VGRCVSVPGWASIDILSRRDGMLNHSFPTYYARVLVRCKAGVVLSLDMSL